MDVHRRNLMKGVLTGSTLLALSMGWLRNLSDPVDTYNNTWTPTSDANIYFSQDFYTRLWVAPTAAGGPNHTLTFAKSQYPEGEISQALIEVKNGGAVEVKYLLVSPSGFEGARAWLTAASLLVMLGGVAVCSYAGKWKEQGKSSNGPVSYRMGIVICILSGIFSACGNLLPSPSICPNFACSADRSRLAPPGINSVRSR